MPQINFLHQLANASGQGCVIVLTGDYHYGDLKVAQPGPSAYASLLLTTQLARPVYQIMSSGMSSSTAHG